MASQIFLGLNLNAMYLDSKLNGIELFIYNLFCKQEGHLRGNMCSANKTKPLGS